VTIPISLGLASGVSVGQDTGDQVVDHEAEIRIALARQ
jgi:hypothetical protein